MVMFQATAMLQDIVPAATGAAKPSGFKGGPEKGGGFEKVLQGRQSPEQGEQAPSDAGRGGERAASVTARFSAQRRQGGQLKPPQEAQSEAGEQQQADEEQGTAQGVGMNNPAAAKPAPGKAEESQAPEETAQKEGKDDAAAQSADAAALLEGKVVVALPAAANGNPILEAKTVGVAGQAAAAVEAAGDKGAAGEAGEAGAGKEVPAEGAAASATGAAKSQGVASGTGESLDQALQQEKAAAHAVPAVPVQGGADGQEVSKVASRQGEQQQGGKPVQQVRKQDDGAAGSVGKQQQAGMAALRSDAGIFYQKNPVQQWPAKEKPPEVAPATPTPLDAGQQGEQTATAVKQNEAQQHPSAGAAEGASKGVQLQGMKAATQELGGTAQQPAAQAPDAPQGKDGSAALKKEQHGAEPAQLRHGLREVAPEESSAVQKTAPEEGSGSKAAPAADTSKAAAGQQQPGQEGSGDASGKGHQEQNAQGKQGEQLPGPALGVQHAPAESVPAETKQGGQKTPLHESILSQVKAGVVSHDGKGNGQVSIRLNPGELGELKIQVRMEDNRLRIEVQADNRMVKNLLMSNLDSLKDALSGKNFTMDGFDVSTGGNGAFERPLSEQREDSRQQTMLRSARSGYGQAERSEGQVKYLTAEVNNLLDVRF